MSKPRRGASRSRGFLFLGRLAARRAKRVEPGVPVRSSNNGTSADLGKA